MHNKFADFVEKFLLWRLWR